MAHNQVYPHAWVGTPITTIFYQGMLSTQSQCARFTGTRGFTMTSGERISRTCSFGIDFDVIQNPFIGAEIDEVAPAHRAGFLRKRDYAFTARTTFPHTFIISSAPTNTSYSLKGHTIKVRAINMGQEGDIKNHFRKVVLHYFINGKKPRISFGVSRGAATTFNAEVIYHFLRNEKSMSQEIPASIEPYLRMLKDEYRVLYALVRGDTEQPDNISTKTWKSACKWWHLHVRSDIKRVCLLENRENPFSGNIQWDEIVSAPELIVIEGCYDSINSLLKSPEIPYIKKILFSWLRIFLKTKFFAFRSRGIDPLLLAPYFPANIPIAFITSHKDNRVPYKNSLRLYNKISAHNKYLLELKNSTHNGYACEHESDMRAYLYFLHGLYKKYNLAYIPEYAIPGSYLLHHAEQTSSQKMHE